MVFATIIGEKTGGGFTSLGDPGPHSEVKARYREITSREAPKDVFRVHLVSTRGKEKSHRFRSQEAEASKSSKAQTKTTTTKKD